MKVRLGLVLIAIASVITGSAAIAPQIASPTTDRIAALERQVADLAARVTALEAAPSPTPTPAPTAAPTPTLAPTPAPSGFTDLPGWDLRFADEFNDRTVARGQFLAGSPDGYHTADGRYLAYKAGWRDTSKNGVYDPSIIAIANGKLDIFIQWRDGAPRVATIAPMPAGGTAKGGLLGMRVESRIRADLMVGYKGVPMLWADAATTNDLLLVYGENDWPESNFDKPPAAFMHRTNATSFSDQDWYPSPTGTTWQDWHSYVIEWIPGKSVEFFIDGTSIGKSTSRIPTTAMHANWQFETWTNGVMPSSTVSGHVEIDRIGVWAYAP